MQFIVLFLIDCLSNNVIKEYIKQPYFFFCIVKPNAFYLIKLITLVILICNCNETKENQMIKTEAGNKFKLKNNSLKERKVY